MQKHETSKIATPARHDGRSSRQRQFDRRGSLRAHQQAAEPGFYEDLKAGLVTVRKAGRKRSFPGPVARRYIAGETGKA